MVEWNLPISVAINFISALIILPGSMIDIEWLKEICLSFVVIIDIVEKKPLSARLDNGFVISSPLLIMPRLLPERIPLEFSEISYGTLTFSHVASIVEPIITVIVN